MIEAKPLDGAKLAQRQTTPNPHVGAFSVKNVCRFFIASTDPIPVKGIRLLRGAENETSIDLCNEEADVNKRAFLQHQLHVKNIQDAATRVGNLTMQNENSKWSLSEKTRLNLHTLRAAHDASSVDVNTILQNNPFLTTRLPHGGKNPLQLIVSSPSRTPLEHGTVLQNPAMETCKITQESRKFTDFPIVQMESIPGMIGGVC